MQTTFETLKWQRICLSGLATNISFKSHSQLDFDHWKIQTRTFFLLLVKRERHVSKMDMFLTVAWKGKLFSWINYFYKLISWIIRVLYLWLWWKNIFNERNSMLLIVMWVPVLLRCKNKMVFLNIHSRDSHLWYIPSF